MVAVWRSLEVETILGGPLDAAGLTESALDRLVSNAVRETEQIDFKGAMYRKSSGSRPSWTEEQEFAKDVAAFANHVGGVILIGVEARDDVAVALSPFTSSTPAAEEQRLRQALSNYQAPMAETTFIPISASSGGWFMAVVVPPSGRSPHAILGDPGDSRRPLHYPVRHGSDTNWLTEPEVAERYRRRWSAESLRVARVERVLDEGFRALRRTTGAWLYFTCVPELEVPGRLDAQVAQEIEKWYGGDSLNSPLGGYLRALGRGIPAPGRVTFTEALGSGNKDETEPAGGYVDLYVDGAALAAVPVAADTAEGEGYRLGELTLVDDAILVADVCLRWSVHQQGAWGTATTVIGIHDATGEGGRPVSALELVSSDAGALRRIPGTRAVVDAPRADTVADLAAVDSVQRRLAVTQQALSGLLQWFGLPEPLQIRRDGGLVARQWSISRYRQVERWAADHGVECEVLPST